MKRTKRLKIKKKVIKKSFSGIKHFSAAIYFYKNGIIHRAHGPAVIFKNKTKIWIRYGVRHRIEGPAFISITGAYSSWYQNGKLHRLDGPAIIGPNLKYSFWNNGVEIPREEWWNGLSSKQKTRALFIEDSGVNLLKLHTMKI